MTHLVLCELFKPKHYKINDINKKKNFFFCILFCGLNFACWFIDLFNFYNYLHWKDSGDPDISNKFLLFTYDDICFPEKEKYWNNVKLKAKYGLSLGDLEAKGAIPVNTPASTEKEKPIQDFWAKNCK